MSTTRLQTLRNEKANALRKIDEISGKIDSTPDDQLDALIAESTEQQDIVRSRNEMIVRLEGASNAGQEAKRELDLLTAPVYGAGTNPNLGNDLPQSWGEQFIRSPQFTELMNKISAGGQTTRGAFGSSAPVPLKEGAATRAVLSSGGAQVVSSGTVAPQRVAPFVFPLQPTDLLDIIPVLTTNSNAVAFARFGNFVNNANVVPETTQASRNHATNGVKPESALDVSLQTAVVEVIGHIFAASRQSLDDVDQLRQTIDLYGEGGVRLKVASAVVNGLGSITGLLQDTGVQDQDFDTDMLATLRKAITKVRVTGLSQPTAFVMNPLDVEKLDLQKDEIGRYYFGGPSRVGVPGVWSLPIVESFDIPENRALVGDFARGCALYKRQDTTLYISDSHLDWFARNLLALLFEARYAFAIRAPKAFVDIDLNMAD